MIELESHFSRSSGVEVMLTKFGSKHNVTYYKWSPVVDTDANGDTRGTPTDSMMKLGQQRKLEGELDQALVTTKNLARPTKSVSLAAPASGGPWSSELYYSTGLSYIHATVSRPRLYSTSAVGKQRSVLH